MGRYKYRYTGWEEFKNYAADMGSGTVIHRASFIKNGSGIQKLVWGIHIHIYTLTDSKEIT
jgi:hypothetical protein